MTTIVVAAILQVVGDSRWQTSVFLQKESGGFFLPIKAQVRRAEGLAHRQNYRRYDHHRKITVSSVTQGT